MLTSVDRVYDICLSGRRKSNFPRKQIIRLGCILTSVDMTDINLTTNKVQIDYYMVRFNFFQMIIKSKIPPPIRHLIGQGPSVTNKCTLVHLALTQVSVLTFFKFKNGVKVSKSAV